MLTSHLVQNHLPNLRPLQLTLPTNIHPHQLPLQAPRNRLRIFRRPLRRPLTLGHKPIRQLIIRAKEDHTKLRLGTTGVDARITQSFERLVVVASAGDDGDWAAGEVV